LNRRKFLGTSSLLAALPAYAKAVEKWNSLSCLDEVSLWKTVQEEFLINNNQEYINLNCGSAGLITNTSFKVLTEAIEKSNTQTDQFV